MENPGGVTGVFLFFRKLRRFAKARAYLETLHKHMDETMTRISITLTAAMLAVGLSGCVGAAGFSTWEYQSGTGYESARVKEIRIQADLRQGFTHEACTSMSSRQIAASGEIEGADLTACRFN